MTPTANISPSGLSVIPEPTRVSLLNVAIPATSKIPVLTFAVAAIPVKFAPLIAGNVDGNLASGIVPELRFDAFREDPSIKPAPLVIALLLRDMFADPSKLTPAMVLAAVSYTHLRAHET